MSKQARVILFLVEGPSDESALARPLEALWKERARLSGLSVEPDAFHCDVTTVHLFRHDDVGFEVTDRVADNVRSFILERIEKSHKYTWNDLARVIHIVDLDGAFVPDGCARVGEGPGFQYGEDYIAAPDTSQILRRNHGKAASLRKLISRRNLKFKKRAVPYEVYFVSRNLEHAMYGCDLDLSDREKEALAIAFGDKYCADPEGFARLLASDKVRVPGDSLAETWEYAQQGTNSLKRGSNLHLLIDLPSVAPEQ